MSDQARGCSQDKGRAGGGRGAAAGASPQLASRTSNARLGPEPMDEDKPGPLQPIELLESSVTDLQGHDGTVYTCAWHQSEQLLASGSVHTHTHTHTHTRFFSPWCRRKRRPVKSTAARLKQVCVCVCVCVP